MKSFLSTLVVLLIMAICKSAFAAAEPEYTDFPSPIYNGVRGELRMDNQVARELALELRQAIKSEINFAGKYVFYRWQCGPKCAAGAALNVADGTLVPFPHTVCCWSKGLFPYYFTSESRLISFGGRIDGKGPVKRHYFEFTGKAFKPVTSKSLLRAKADLAKIEPAAGSQPDAFEAIASNPKTAPFWTCFQTGLKMVSEEISKQSTDDKSYFQNVAMLGGYMTVGDKVRVACNDQLLGKGKPPTTPESKAANDLFVLELWMNDRKIYSSCAAQSGREWDQVKKFCRKSEELAKAKYKSARENGVRQ